MPKGYKRMIVPVISLIILIACVSCAVASKVNENAQTAPITSKWTFDHATNDGKNVHRYLFDKEEDLPHFSSDGENFRFNITPGNEYTGTIELNDDGTYTLYRNGDKDKRIRASITGNALTVYTTDDSTVVFVVI
jgi:hypothetical protein